MLRSSQLTSSKTEPQLPVFSALHGRFKPCARTPHFPSETTVSWVRYNPGLWVWKSFLPPSMTVHISVMLLELFIVNWHQAIFFSLLFQFIRSVWLDHFGLQDLLSPCRVEGGLSTCCSVDSRKKGLWQPCPHVSLSALAPCMKQVYRDPGQAAT